MVVCLVAARPRLEDPQLSITISVKMTSLQENAEVSMQDAQTAVAVAGIESQRDFGLELENGVKDLQDVLGSVVDTNIDKIDVLAEVGLLGTMSYNRVQAFHVGGGRRI